MKPKLAPSTSTPPSRPRGWGVVEGSRVLREHGITLRPAAGQRRQGRARQGRDRRLRSRLPQHKAGRHRGQGLGQTPTEGVSQAKSYAAKLAVRYTYATNGQAIYGIDMATGAEGDVASYPSPEELWNLTFAEATPGATVFPPCRSRTRPAPGRALLPGHRD
jgi:type I restriction enzyme R subunit